MTLKFMLDTNIISDVIRNPNGNASKRWVALGDDSLSISAIAVSELRFGVLKRGSARLRTLSEELLSRIQVLPYEAEASHHYAEIREALEKVGKPIGATDLFIAAHARFLDLTLATANTREFRRVPDL